MSRTEESIDDMEKFNEKIYEDGITWLFGHHCLECGHLTFAQHEVKELAKYFYELGYHQAEKDLDISWVKEVSGVKEMKRAKEEALKAYPPQSIAANYDTINRRDAFEYGYLKAEKDLELTWEDMFSIFRLINEVLDDYAEGKTKKEVGEEVLRRFKAQKGK